MRTQIQNKSNFIAIKTPEQINGIRKACQLSAKALIFGGTLVKPGVSTLFINNEIYKFIKNNGGKSASLGYHNFPSETCISINEEVCHGIGKPDKILKDFDLVKIDTACIFDGFYGDTCGTFIAGKSTKNAKKFVEDVEHCRNIGINVCKPGVKYSKIGSTIGRYARSLKYGVVTQLSGHHCGLEFHENSPNISHDESKYDFDPIMEIGHVFTIEPMITMGKPNVIVNKSDGWTVSTKDGSLSAQFEHMILITETGNEILTKI